MVFSDCSFSRFIHAVCSMFQHCFLLNTFSLFGYIAPCLSIHWWVFRLSGYYELCYCEDSCSSLCRCVFISLGPIGRSRIDEPYGNSILTFWGTAKLFLKVAAPYYIPASNVQGLDLSTFLSTLVIVHLFFFLTIAVWTGGKWYFIVALIWFL